MVPRAKSAERLYDAVADYDLVITPDGPLASSLNRQLDRPHLGPYAVLPRRDAAGRRETAEERLAFLEMVDHDTISTDRSLLRHPCPLLLQRQLHLINNLLPKSALL